MRMRTRVTTGSVASSAGGLLRRVLPVAMALIATCAVAVLILLPSTHSAAVLDIQSLPPGVPSEETQAFTYYANASIEVRGGVDTGEDKPGQVLRCRVLPAEGWTGFGIVTSAAPAQAATLRLRWRCTGTAPHIQVDVQEVGEGAGRLPGEVFSAMVPFVFGQWVTTPLPLRNLLPNQNYQPPTAAINGVLDTDRLGTVAFTLPPHSDMTVEIAEFAFVWPGAKWQVLGVLLVLLFLLLMVQILYLTRGRLDAERTLKASEANYRAIFNAVGEGIWVLDADTGATLDVNRTACEMLGVPRASMLGRSFSAIAREVGAEELAAAFEADGSAPSREWESRIGDRGGRPLWCDVRAARTEIGERTRQLVVLREISEKKEAEQERLRLEQRLMQSQKMEALGQLAGGVAHDFNNILTGITLAAEVALLKGGANQAAGSGLQQIKELAGRAKALTQQMLTFSRRQPMRTVPVRLNGLVVHGMAMLHRLIGEDINLSFAAETDRDLIQADRSQIEQVLVNLAINARHAMPAGGDLRITTRSERGGKGPAQALPEGEYVILEVADTGHGMDEATRERIFEPFFTTKEVGKGTGLGLATVYGIATRHGAAITVDSAPGSGTTFRICFPHIEGTEEAPVVEAPASAAPPRGTELILIVEDNAEVRGLLEVTLGGLGYRTVSADCPAQAESIYRARRHEVALLLSDVVMPGESGPQFFRRMAREDPGLKVVFISGYADARSGCEEVLRDGLPFLQKPFAPGDLARTIRETLDLGRPVSLPPAP